MKNLKLKYSILILAFSVQLSAQNVCSEAYVKVHDLQMESHSIINDGSLSLSKRIRQSKKLAKESLKLAYKTIEENDCEKYSIIVDRIIELELQLGNPKKAESIALKRLNKRTPKWDSEKGKAYASDLEILATISSYKKSNSFYKIVRKYKGVYGVCGTTTYEQDVSALLWKAEMLFKNYGEVFCLKFLQSSTIIINEDNEKAILIWDKVYDLIVKSIGINTPYSEIKREYESAEVQFKELQDWERSVWEFEFLKSQYFFEFEGIRIFFKTTSCPNDQNKYKRCQPNNLETLKNESKLYKKIKEYVSLQAATTIMPPIVGTTGAAKQFHDIINQNQVV